MRHMTASERALAEQMKEGTDVPSTLMVRGSWWLDRGGAALRTTIGLLLGLAIWQVMAMVLNSNGSTLGFPYPVQTFERLGAYLFGGRSLSGTPCTSMF